MTLYFFVININPNETLISATYYWQTFSDDLSKPQYLKFNYTNTFFCSLKAATAYNERLD